MLKQIIIFMILSGSLFSCRTIEKVSRQKQDVEYIKKANAAKDYGKKLYYYNKAIEHNPDNADYYHERGIIYYKLKKLKSSLYDYDMAINLDPNNLDYFFNKGISLYHLGAFDQALLNFNIVIEEREQDYASYYFRAMIYSIQNQYDEALINYNKALKINPQHVYAHFYKALLLEKNNQYEEAIEYYHKAIEINPDFASAYNNLGGIYFKQKNDKKALEILSKIMKKKPEYALAHRNYSEVLLIMNDLDQAFKHLNKAIEIDKNARSFYILRGRLYFNLNQYHKAIVDISNGLKTRNSKSNVFFEDYLLLALSYFQLNDLKNTRKYFKLFQSFDEKFKTSQLDYILEKTRFSDYEKLELIRTYSKLVELMH